VAVLLLSCAVAWAPDAAADGASPLDASAQDKKRAQTRYEDGAKMFEARRFSDALKAFQDSYRIVASPNSHLMVARSMRELGQLALAYEELEKAEEEARALAGADAAKYGPTVEKASADREALKPRIALVTVRVKGGEPNDLSVGGRAVPRDRWSRPIAANPGNVEVVATGRDGSRVAKAVSVNAGQAGDVEIDLTPRTDAAAAVSAPIGPEPSQPGPAPDAGGTPKKSLMPWVFVAGGVGVAGLGLGTIFGIMNNSTFDEYETELADLKARKLCRDEQGSLKCDDTPEVQAVMDKGDKGKTQQTIANVGYIVGGVGLGVAAALLIVDLTRSSKSSDSAAAPSTTVVAGWRTVGVVGSF
jgi:hypothetical protein